MKGKFDFAFPLLFVFYKVAGLSIFPRITGRFLFLVLGLSKAMVPFHL